MGYLEKINKLCKPAYVYFVISFFAIIFLVIQNFMYGNNKKYCVGSYSCEVTSSFTIFILKFLYIIFWTVVLDALCKYGYTNLSWFLVIFPFLLMAVLVGLLFLYASK